MKEMAEVKTIKNTQKSKKSFKKDNINKRELQVVQIKAFVHSFYARYDRMMAKLSHE